MNFMRVIMAVLFALIFFVLGHLAPHSGGSVALAAVQSSVPGSFSLAGPVTVTNANDFSNCTSGKQCTATITVQYSPDQVPTGVNCANSAQGCLVLTSLNGTATINGANGSTTYNSTAYSAMAIQVQ